jgi:hypothetical protein
MAGRMVALTAGLLLLFASLTKGLALAETSISPDWVPGEWWLSFAAAGVELFLGLWLVTGVFPAVARWAAIACFAGFAGVAVYKGVSGEASCDCLGNIQISPWSMLAVDVLVVGAMWWARPQQPLVVERRTGALVLAGALALTAGLGLKVYEAGTALSRGLVIDAPYHDFGEVEQRQILTHVFTLENRCSYPVEVAKTTLACNCTTTGGVAGQVVEPGGRLEIPVTFDTREYEEQVRGRVTLYCRRAGSSTPATTFRQVVVTATVEPDYWVRPLLLDFGEVPDGKSGTRVALLRPNRMKDVQVTRMTSSDPAFRGRLLDDRTPDGDLQVEFTFAAPGLTESRQVDSTLTIHTTSPRRPRIDVSARAYHQASVVSEPKAIVVGTDVAGEVVREVTVAGGRPIRVENCQSTSPQVRVAAVEESPTRWRVAVTLPSDTGRTGLNAEVRFEVRYQDATTAEEARVVAVPVHRLRP